MQKTMKLTLFAAALMLSVVLTACSDGKTEEEKQAEAVATALEESGLGEFFGSSGFAPDRDVKTWELGKPVDGVTDGVTVKIERIIWKKQISVPGGIFGHTADGMYAIFIASIENQSNDSVEPRDELGSLYIEDDAGRQHNHTLLLALDHDSMEVLFDEITADIARPQKTIKSYFVIEVPESSNGITLRSEKLGISIPLGR